MTLLPSQVDRLDVRLELAFGADIDAPWSWDWVEMGPDSWAGGENRPRLLAQTITPRRGSADETSRPQPSTFTFELDNSDGALTPGNPVSPWWPNIDRGVPCRLSRMPGEGAPALLLDGSDWSFASMPDNAVLDVTDLDVACDVTPRSWGASQILAGRHLVTGDQRSWLLYTYGGKLILQWSPNGTAAAVIRARTLGKPLYQLAGRHAIRPKLDVNNGSGGWTVTFEIADTAAGPWEAFGDPIEGVGVTSIHPGTAPFTVGAAAAGSPGFADTQCFAGRVHSVVHRDSIAGSVIASPDFAAQAEGTTGFVDAQGRSWSVGGAGEITRRRVLAVGQLAEITPTWPHGDTSGPDPVTQPGDARVTVTSAGILRRLGQGEKPLDSSIRRRIMSTQWSPALLAYWPCEDGSEATSAASPLPGVGPMGFVGYAYAADDTLAATLPAPKVSSGPCGYSGTIPPPASTLTTWAVEAFVRMPTGPSSLFPLFVVSSTQTVRKWIISASATQLQVLGLDDDGGTVVTNTPPNDAEFFAQWTLLRFEVTQDGGNIDWLFSWVPLNRSALAFQYSGTVAGNIGRPTIVGQLASSAPPDGFSICHVIAQSGNGLGWLAQAETAFDGETAATRFARLCDEEGIPNTILGDRATSEPMGPQRASTLLDLLQECAVADAGRFFEARDRLALVYRTRETLYNQPPRLVLDAAASEITNPFVPSLDDLALRNDVTAERPNGTTARRTTDPPPQKGDLYDTHVTVNVEQDTQLDQQAAWRLHLGTWPGMRYPSLSSELTTAPRLIDEWPDVDIGDRVQVVNLPPQHPTDEVDVILDGIADPISPTVWTPEANCSPAGPWTVGVLDGAGTPDVTLARLATDGSTLATGIDADDLSLSVARTDPDTPLWTTAAAQFPMRIVIGGEEIELSGISGASSPQTFTVAQRAVNGVHKAHPAGAAVQAADPFRIAL